MFQEIRESLFAKVWQREAPFADTRLRMLKKDLLASCYGKVLELGPGTGVNFDYLPDDILWLGIEPNRRLQKVLRANPRRPSSFQLVADISELPKASVDTVLSTLVLCSVPNLEETLKQIGRVLKPGGEFLCLEHVAAPRGTLLRLAQRFFRPFSRCLGGGCEPDREIDQAIQRMTRFSIISIRKHWVQLSRLPLKVPVIVARAHK